MAVAARGFAPRHRPAGASRPMAMSHERKLHFEAEVSDKGGALVDRGIIDKRSGRTGSTFWRPP